MLEPLTQRQQDLIVKNVIRSLEDIESLNRTGYNFLYLASGFIAHYDINGFKAYYSDHSLEQDILDNARQNMWLNFQPGDQNYEYYKSKAEVYKRILSDIVQMEVA